MASMTSRLRRTYGQPFSLIPVERRLELLDYLAAAASGRALLGHTKERLSRIEGNDRGVGEQR
jgi:hypothetical protein